MFGYATDETPELLPMTVLLAHQLNIELSKRRRDGSMPWLLPDSSNILPVAANHRNPSHNGISTRSIWPSNPSEGPHNSHLNPTRRNNLHDLPPPTSPLRHHTTSHPIPSH